MRYIWTNYLLIIVSLVKRQYPNSDVKIITDFSHTNIKIWDKKKEENKNSRKRFCYAWKPKKPNSYSREAIGRLFFLYPIRSVEVLEIWDKKEEEETIIRHFKCTTQNKITWHECQIYKYKLTFYNASPSMT